uniref:C2 domain-containing protein n=1 Tax=Percolomonas cosmopolitus TaxID=63605 RepID=A0A7S1KSV8_9EUKA
MPSPTSSTSSTLLISESKHPTLFSDFHYDMQTSSFGGHSSRESHDDQARSEECVQGLKLPEKIDGGSVCASPNSISSMDRLLTLHHNNRSPESSLMHTSDSVSTMSRTVSSPLHEMQLKSCVNIKSNTLPEDYPRSILTNKLTDRMARQPKNVSLSNRLRNLIGVKASKCAEKQKRVTISTPQKLTDGNSSGKGGDLTWNKIEEFNQSFTKDIPVSEAFAGHPKLNIKHYGQSHRYTPNQADDTSSEISRSTVASHKKRNKESLVNLVSSQPKHVIQSGRCHKKIKKGNIRIKMSPGKTKTFIFGIGFEVDKKHTLGQVKPKSHHQVSSLVEYSSHDINHEFPHFEDPHFHPKKEMDEEDMPHIGERIREKNASTMSPLHRTSAFQQRHFNKKSLTNMIRPISMKNLARLSSSWNITGSDDGHHNDSGYDQALQTECAKELPVHMQKKLSIYRGKKFTYSLRSSLLLYDRFGFLLKGSYVRKKMKNHLSYKFERRRAIQDAITVLLEEDYTCTIARSVSNANKRYAEKSSRLGDMLYSVKDSFLYPKNNFEDQLFVENDSCYDVEQLRLELTDADLVKHLILVLHFDAPTLAFAHKKCISNNMKALHLLSQCIPHVRPYIRVIDADESKEMVRYYIDHAPKLSVTLEMNQVVRKNFESVDRLVLEVEEAKGNEYHNQFQHRSRHSSFKNPKKNSSKREPNSPATQQSQNSQSLVHPDVETDSLSNPSEEDDDNCSTDGSEVSLQEIKVDESRREEIRGHADVEWQTVPLLDEYRFETPYGMESERVLSQFLFQSNENDFGTKSIPELPKKYCVTVEQARNINIGRKSTFLSSRSSYFCIVSTDSAHQTEKKRTKRLPHSHTMMWSEEFQFIVQPSCRSSAVIVEVFERNRIGLEKLVGVASFPFGSIHGRSTSYSAYSGQWCPLYNRGVQRGEIMLRLELFWRPKITLNTDHGSTMLVED